jgi:integrase
MPKLPSFSPLPSGNPSRPWVINVPAKWSESGKRERQFFESKARAKTHGDLQTIRIAKQKVKEADQGPLLSPVEREIAAAIFRLLADRPPHVALDMVAAQIDREAARTASVTVARLFELYMAECEVKTRKGRKLSESYRTQVKYTGPRFSAIHDIVLTDLTRLEIEECIQTVSPAMRNSLIRVIAAALEFGKDKGWCKENPARGIQKSDTGELEIGILTPLQAAKLMVATIRLFPDLVPAMALMLFAGIRPQREITRLRWEHIRLKDKVIFMPGEITKTGFQRYVQIEPNLAAWLQWHINQERACKGPVVILIHRTTRKNDKNHPRQHSFRNQLEAIRAEARITPWPQDGARHSYASYWMAINRDEDQCRDNMGHRTKDELQKHYRKHVQEAVAKRYFAIRPKVVTSSPSLLHL